MGTVTRQRWTLQRPYVVVCPSQKVSYRDEADARDAVDDMMARNQVKPGCHLFPYDCPGCGGWHVANRRIYFPQD